MSAFDFIYFISLFCTIRVNIFVQNSTCFFFFFLYNITISTYSLFIFPKCKSEVKFMKCKVNGFWNSNGSGTDDNGRSFSWNNFFFSVSYTDKKQVNMIGEKSKTLKVKASDLNQMLGLGLSSEACLNFSSEALQQLAGILHGTVLIEFDDDSNLIDFEVLQEGKTPTK